MLLPGPVRGALHMLPHLGTNGSSQPLDGVGIRVSVLQINRCPDERFMGLLSGIPWNYSFTGCTNILWGPDVFQALFRCQAVAVDSVVRGPCWGTEGKRTNEDIKKS